MAARGEGRENRCACACAYMRACVYVDIRVFMLAATTSAADRGEQASGAEENPPETRREGSAKPRGHHAYRRSPYKSLAAPAKLRIITQYSVD